MTGEVLAGLVAPSRETPGPRVTGELGPVVARPLPGDRLLEEADRLLEDTQDTQEQQQGEETLTLTWR